MADQISSDEGEQFIEKEIASGLRWSLSGQKLWSFANNGSTVCIVIFSAVAAVLSQVDSKAFLDSGVRILSSIEPKTWATILSLAVTIISTIQSKLGFERKWIANRMTQSSLRQLQIDEKIKVVSSEELAAKLKNILETHDKTITGTASAG